MSATDTPQSPRPSSWTLGGGGAKRHSSLHIVRRLSRSKSAASASATTSPSSSSAPSSFSLTDRPKSSVVPAAPNPTFTGAKDTHQTKSKYAALLTSFFADVTPILSVNPVIAQPRRALTMRPDLPSKRASTPDIRGGILSSAPVHGSARIKKIFRRSWTSGGSVSSTSSSVASTATFVSEMEYRDIEKALARFHSKERHRVEILRTQLIPWLQQSDDDVLIAEILDPEREKETAATKMMMIKWCVERERLGCCG
ncbi:hypothetical protein BC937DRAFT_87143 [Endogone sp. FLAS-F59071]|nr:hypothetical protein BC937DRAFT_87143 [Endogone sp. FLAS-F59071]|eukprot:RUS12735.1 hypothetical protein BC937DRAFT_87143 [Endogone sp. FLAS-F59071]